LPPRIYMIVLTFSGFDRVYFLQFATQSLHFFPYLSLRRTYEKSVDFGIEVAWSRVASILACISRFSTPPHQQSLQCNQPDHDFSYIKYNCSPCLSTPSSCLSPAPPLLFTWIVIIHLQMDFLKDILLNELSSFLVF
jgi:hypothetical protein